MSNSVVKLIEQRKKNNAYYDMMNGTMADLKRVQQRAEFEISTTKKIEKKQKEKRLLELKREQEASLLHRKHQLAELYNSEIESWREEVLASVETVEDRKRRIMERANALRDKREATRGEYVKHALDAQWRDACDDARTLDSMAMLQYVNNERLAQIEEKIRRKERLSAKENEFYDEWQRHLAEYDRKEEEKLKQREFAQQSTLTSIRSQIDESKARKESTFKQSREEDAREISNIRKAIADDEAVIRERQVDAFRRGKEVQQLNAQVKAVKLEEEQIGREQDNYLLNYALEQERKAAAEEESKRLHAKKAAIEFKKCLELQMQREAEDNAFVDEMRRREEEKVFKQRDDTLRAREDARHELMKQVHDGRQEQIALRERDIALQKQEEALWAAKFIEDAEQGKQKERDAAARRRKIASDNNVKLQDQIHIRKEMEEREKQETYLSDKHMQHIERAHREKLAAQGGAVRDFRPIKKSQWYT